MRKIRRPNITVKAREVFYQLKRTRLLEGLDEATIEEILNKENPAKLVNPGFLYESFETQTLEDRGELGSWPFGATFSAAVATIGDAGFEERIKNLDSQTTHDALCNTQYVLIRRVLWAWAEALLLKLVDLANGLIAEEASQETNETGPSFSVIAANHKKLWDFLLTALNPQEKLGIQITLDPVDNTPKVSPSLSRFWLVPWLTKKEKKQFALQ